MTSQSRFPHWLRVRSPSARASARMGREAYAEGQRSICVEARCPNRWECSRAGVATFLILGPHCSRSCAFCAVSHGVGAALDSDEPRRVARAAGSLGLTHVVVTSVTRDDVPDGGASAFAAVVEAIRGNAAGTSVELLVPDFRGSREALKRVAHAAPEVIGHNMETTSALYPMMRRGADYRRSLDLLRTVREASGTVVTKSGVMVGLGETRADLCALFRDLRDAGVSIVTVGQYLRPTRRNVKVMRLLEPDEFGDIAEDARAAGIPHVVAGPLVRSSYRAKEVFLAAGGALMSRGSFAE